MNDPGSTPGAASHLSAADALSGNPHRALDLSHNGLTPGQHTQWQPRSDSYGPSPQYEPHPGYGQASLLSPPMSGGHPLYPGLHGPPGYGQHHDYHSQQYFPQHQPMSRQPLAQVHSAQQPSISQMQSVPDTQQQQQQLSQATLEKQPADQEQQPPALPAVIHQRGKKKVDAPIPAPAGKRRRTGKQTIGSLRQRQRSHVGRTGQHQKTCM